MQEGSKYYSGNFAAIGNVRGKWWEMSSCPVSILAWWWWWRWWRWNTPSCPMSTCVQSTRAWNFWGVSAIWGEIPCCPSAGGGELHDNPSFNSPIFVFVCFLFVFVYFLFVFVYLSTGLGAAGGESHGSPSLNSPVGRSHCSVTESPPSSILFCKTENFGVSFKNVNLFEKKCVWKERRTCQLIFLFWKYLSEI